MLAKPDIELTGDDRARIKAGARDLLAVLKREKLVLDWRKRQQSRAQVRATIEEMLDQTLPETYTPELYQQKVEALYQHIFDADQDQNRGIYGPAA